MMDIRSEQQAQEFVQSLCGTKAYGILEQYVALLIEENARQNLIAKASEAIIWQRHIADSAQLLTYAEANKGDVWLDLGSGPGLPGLVIAILRPELEVVLVESRGLRAAWLAQTITALGVKNCRVEGQRLERVSPFKADFISARAFAPLHQLFSLSARFSTAETRWLLPKGRSAAQELQELPRWQRRMFHVEHSLTDADSGVVVGRLGQGALAKLTV